MISKRFFGIFTIFTLFVAVSASAQITYPKPYPSAVITDKDTGEEREFTPGGDTDAFSAPLTVKLRANTEDLGDYKASYHWLITCNQERLAKHDGDNDGNREEILTASGIYSFRLQCEFENADGKILIGYDENEVDDDPKLIAVLEGDDPIVLTIKNSKLEMPNAFSPNGDGINDYYGAKSYGDSKGEAYCERGESIVEFHAIIISRWGQKIYSWDDVNGSWDGTMNGTPVKDGVYYVSVQAKGADGHVYNIKKDVNLLRGFKSKDGAPVTE